MSYTAAIKYVMGLHGKQTSIAFYRYTNAYDVRYFNTVQASYSDSDTIDFGAVNASTPSMLTFYRTAVVNLYITRY